jgi:FixJ family two-component response regulator
MALLSYSCSTTNPGSWLPSDAFCGPTALPSVWTSPVEFLKLHEAQTPDCLVMDVCMPQMSGLEVQRVLLARGTDRPVIFITGQGDVHTTVLGMKAGAVTS